MSTPQLEIDGVRVPCFMYGTAWKEQETRRLVTLAIEHGFRAIDTANQRRHYFEEAVGQGISDAIGRGFVARNDLFLQTKFTFRPGQDHRLPYDPAAPIGSQVEQSFASSLSHLGVDTIDSYVLHGPMYRGVLADEDWEAWRAMEALHESQKTRMLGVSNVSLAQLEALCAGAKVRPRFVQNRCFAVTGWDYHVREFCRENGIVYQGFSLLTANPQVLASAGLRAIAKKHERTPTQVVFRFAIDIGMLPLTGTTNADHMKSGLEVLGFALSAEDVHAIERIGLER